MNNTYEDGEVAHLADLIVGEFQSSDLLISNQVAQVRALNLIVTELNLKKASTLLTSIGVKTQNHSSLSNGMRDKLVGAVSQVERKTRTFLSDWHLGTYPVEGVFESWEVLQRLESADVEADHFELSELFEVWFVVGCKSLEDCLIENQIVELKTKRKQQS